MKQKETEEMIKSSNPIRKMELKEKKRSKVRANKKL